MRMNFKVSFYLRSNYENKEGKSPVMLRVFLNGEHAEFICMVSPDGPTNDSHLVGTGVPDGPSV